MTEKELRKVEKEVNERLKKRLEEDKILPAKAVSIELGRVLEELGFRIPDDDPRHLYCWMTEEPVEGIPDSIVDLVLAHNRFKKKMKKLEKAYDEMEEAFEAYKKEVLKNG